MKIEISLPENSKVFPLPTRLRKEKGSLPPDRGVPQQGLLG